MTHQLKPIIITPEQIIAAAQKIANDHDDAWQHSKDQWLTATEFFLRTAVNDLLASVDYHAFQSGGLGPFSLTPECATPGCRRTPLADDIFCDWHRDHENERRQWEADSKNEFVVPPIPEWAQSEQDRIAAPLASRPELKPDEHGEYLWA